MSKHNNNKTIWEFFIKNRKFVFVLVAAIIVLGLISINALPKESSPEVDIPIVTVTTPYAGASPEDVEKLVTNPIEDEVLGLSDLSEITSQSYEGLSSIIVEFDVGVDLDKKVNEVEDAVKKAESNLPDDANDPNVDDVSISEAMPVLRFSMSGPYDVNQLKDIAEKLKENIKRVRDVTEVKITGGQERKFEVLVDKTSLDNFGLSLTNVTNSISSANSDIPVGSIETGGENYTVNLRGQIKSLNEIKNTPITSIKDSVVYVRDVAEVKDTFTKQTSLSRVSRKGGEPMPAVSVSVIKGNEGNILKMVEGVRKEIDAARGTIMPGNVHIEIIDNLAENIRNDINSLGENGLQTIAIILVLLLIFVGWREAILSALAVPITFLISFIVLQYIGYTLNFLTLFALILSLGILVDSIIVVTEGMNRKMKEGYKSREAAILTVREYHLPLIAGTLTTVFAFLPMLLTSGIMGEFIKSLPVTVTITLMAALFVALGLLTSLSVKWMRNAANINNDSENKKSLMERKFIPVYEKMLRKILSSKKLASFFAVIIITAFIGAMYLPGAGILKQDLFPEQDQGYFAINVEEPRGTPIKATSRTTSKIENLFVGDDRIKSFQVNIGSSFNTYISSDSGGENKANIIVNLKEDKEIKSFEVANEYRSKVKNLNIFPAEASVVQLNAGPPSGKPITINITGSSLDKLEDYGAEIKEIVKNTDGTVNTAFSKEESNGQFSIYIDRAKANLYGVSTQQVAGVLRNAVSGSDATVVRTNGDDIDVSVKYDLGDKNENQVDLSTISSLTIATPKGDIPLSTFTNSRLENKRAFIEHKNGKRIIKVTADSISSVSPIEITNEISQKIKNLNMPREYQVSYGGETEDIEQSFNDMIRALLIGVFIIAMIMVLQFKSFRQPLFILITIPLSVIGIFPGLVLTGQPLSFPGVIGIVALAGIVVNNAILLIDAINNGRIFEGLNKKEAVVKAAKIRFQPIILTAATTIGGMIPLAMSNPTWSPIAYSIIFGLLFSTILTLLVVPLLYNFFGEKELDLEKSYEA